MNLTQSFSLVDERLLFGVSQLPPASTKSLTDLGVVHVWSHGCDLLSLNLHVTHKRYVIEPRIVATLKLRVTLTSGESAVVVNYDIPLEANDHIASYYVI